MRTINPQDKKPTELTVEHIELNLQECMRRFDNASNPTYEYHDFWDPLTQRIIPYQRLSRIQWWEEWKRAERMSPSILRHPFKRLGELRAGTDDHAFNEGAKVIEDILVQVSLLRKVLELHKRAAGLQQKRNDKAEAADVHFELPAIQDLPATPLSKETTDALPAEDELPDFEDDTDAEEGQEDATEDADEDPGS